MFLSPDKASERHDKVSLCVLLSAEDAVELLPVCVCVCGWVLDDVKAHFAPGSGSGLGGVSQQDPVSD